MSYKTILENLVRDTQVHIDLQVSSTKKSSHIGRPKITEGGVEERDGLGHRWVDGTVLSVKNGLVIVQLDSVCFCVYLFVCLFIC
jgi:hypothetical protein